MSPATLNFWSVVSIIILCWLVLEYWTTRDRFDALERELGEMRSRLAEAQSLVASLRKKADANGDNIKKLRQNLDKANSNIKKGNDTILMLVNRVQALENRVEDLKRYNRKARSDLDELIEDLGFAPFLTCKTKQERRLKMAYWKLLRQQVMWESVRSSSVDGRTVIVSKPNKKEE